MASKIVCDVCGRECKPSGRYELVYKCTLRTAKDDICLSCMEDIKNIIRDKRMI